ncbi:hypothetical protein [Sediminibacterium soli]|uniref:hypothetical protein n=1 Tax=Sediminibacterium soli TaxID=2698829 RepID=UPI0013796655|nr:hypothetical protein [Sediminibacterium soli]NCI46321.1 hypothetical protein [Sediminibacterium soli]
MKKFLLLHYSALTGLLPAILGAFRFRRAPAIYRPFFYFLWLAVFGDISGILCVYAFRNNIAHSNVYVLAEFLMLLWLFYRWNRSPRKTKYWVIGGIGVAVWILDNLAWHTVYREINSLYRVYYCMVIVFLSIDLINKLIIFERKKLLRNAMFLVCVTFVFYFAYKAYIESFYVLQFSFSRGFYNSIFYVLRIINVLSNLMYSIALLCIPKKLEFSMPR